MSKFIHGPSMAGQSVVDRVLAAKHTVAGQSLAKVTCKATTEEVMGPKRKHLDYLLQCTNEPNVSVPEMANLLIERTQNTNWVVVFKALITVHNLMNYGNERFTQYLASNNCTFNLTSFTDRSGTQGYDMSSYIRRYAKYLNEKAFSYRQMAFDFCKVKRGKEDGMLRTMNTEKLLKTLPVLQSQLDALVEFDVTPNELTNGVINAAFMLLFKDLIRLFACYNDGVINLLEKYFEMNKKNCRDALEIYKKFLGRMDRVCEFLKVAESVGIDKGDIPDLAKAPASLLEALEQHLASLENTKKTSNAAPPKPSSGVSSVISTYAAAAQIGAAPGAGSGVTHISDDERRRILEEEQRQLDQMKQQRMKQMAESSSPASASSAGSAAAAMTTKSASSAVSSPLRSTEQLTTSNASASSAAVSSSLADDLFSISTQQPVFGANSTHQSAFGASASLDSMFLTNSAAPVSFGANPSATSQSLFNANTAFQPQFGGAPSAAYAATSNPFVPAAPPVMVMPPTWGGSPAYMGTPGPAPATSNHTGIDAKFAAAFSSSSTTQKSGYDGFGDILQPSMPGGLEPSSSSMTSRGSVGSGLGSVSQTNAQQTDKLIKSDLDSSLALLAGNLSIRPSGQVKKTDHQWSGAPAERRLTGAGPTWSQPQPVNQPNYPMQAPQMFVKPMTSLNNNQYWVVGMQPSMSMTVQPMMMPSYPVPMAQPAHPAVMGQPVSMTAGAWAPAGQPQMFGVSQPTPRHSTTQQPQSTPNDPFGSL